MNDFIQFLLSILTVVIGVLFGYIIASPGGIFDIILGIIVMLVTVLTSWVIINIDYTDSKKKDDAVVSQEVVGGKQ